MRNRSKTEEEESATGCYLQTRRGREYHWCRGGKGQEIMLVAHIDSEEE